jgi:hypothetical protein
VKHIAARKPTELLRLRSETCECVTEFCFASGAVAYARVNSVFVYVLPFGMVPEQTIRI